MPIRLSLTYYPWISQRISGPELAGAIKAFADLLEPALSKLAGDEAKIELKELEVPAQLDNIELNPADGLAAKIGLLNPLGYALVHARAPKVEAIAVIRRKIGAIVGPTYKAQLYTHRKTAIKAVKDIRGRAIAFGSSQSTSNFLVPADMLFQADIHPLNAFTRVDFAGGHDKAAIAVYEGRADVGAGHDGVIIDLSHKPGYGDADQVLVNLAWSKEIPSDPVAVLTSDSKLRGHIRDALCQVAKPGEPKSPGNLAVERFWGTTEGFEPIGPKAYEVLFDPMKRLGLRPTDMMRK